MTDRISADAVIEMLNDCRAPRVTEENINAKIDCHSFHVETLGTAKITVCFILMRNGFVFVGKAAPASPDNYREVIGRTYAYDDAYRQIWTHEGYLLREKLAGS
jgi:hypothetical protein